MGECDGGKIGQAVALIALSPEALKESGAPDERQTIDGYFERHFWRMLRDKTARLNGPRGAGDNSGLLGAHDDR